VPARRADKYDIEPLHSQVLFSWNHFGFSRLHGWFMQIEGEVVLDQGDLSKSAVSVKIPIGGLDVGVATLDEALKGPLYFDAQRFPEATFRSTRVEPTGAATLKVTGDLTIRGITQSVVLDARINRVGPYPLGNHWPAAGFDATTTIRRSQFGLSRYVPEIGDEIEIRISIETVKSGAEIEA
jgi:polyisoprenoid-binding protein YceI